MYVLSKRKGNNQIYTVNRRGYCLYSVPTQFPIGFICLSMMLQRNKNHFKTLNRETMRNKEHRTILFSFCLAALSTPVLHTRKKVLTLIPSYRTKTQIVYSLTQITKFDKKPQWYRVWCNNLLTLDMSRRLQPRVDHLLFCFKKKALYMIGFKNINPNNLRLSIIDWVRSWKIRNHFNLLADEGNKENRPILYALASHSAAPLVYIPKSYKV